MKIDTINVKMEFNEPLLGSASGNKEVHEEFIAARFTKDQEKLAAIKAKAGPEATSSEIEEAKEEHIATEMANHPEPPEDVDEAMIKAMTVFHRNNDGLFLYDYQIRGFFKEMIRCLIELGDESVKGLSEYQHKRAVDKFLFVNPRYIYLWDLTGRDTWKKAPDVLTRPLRAQTMKGERVALATSEIVPAGTTCQFEVKILRSSAPKAKAALITPKTIRACLELGSFSGFGQWRNAGYGKFSYEMTEDSGQEKN